MDAVPSASNSMEGSGTRKAESESKSAPEVDDVAMETGGEDEKRRKIEHEMQQQQQQQQHGFHNQDMVTSDAARCSTMVEERQAFTMRLLSLLSGPYEDGIMSQVRRVVESIQEDTQRVESGESSLIDLDLADPFTGRDVAMGCIELERNAYETLSSEQLEEADQLFADP